MGYLTDYDVEISGFEDKDAAEFFEFKEIHKKDGILHEISYGGVSEVDYYGTVRFNVTQSKWYMWREDLMKVSVKYPNVTIDVEGNGEEQGDMWKARLRNGEIETVEAEIVFPDFKKLI